MFLFASEYQTSFLCPLIRYQVMASNNSEMGYLDVAYLNWYTELTQNFLGKVSTSFSTVIPVTFSN